MTEQGIEQGDGLESTQSGSIPPQDMWRHSVRPLPPVPSFSPVSLEFYLSVLCVLLSPVPGAGVTHFGGGVVGGGFILPH